jgi:hypothetical protein
LLLNFGL